MVVTQPNGDTDNRYKDGVSLKAYMDTRFDALEKTFEVYMEAMDKRLESMNEIRGAMRDVQFKSVARAECIIKHEKVDENISSLRESRSKGEGMASQKSVNVAYLLTSVAMLISVAAIAVTVLLH